jgi:hypothetical protein
MTEVTYELVAHGGGWVYRAGEVSSGIYPTREAARAAAEAARPPARVADPDEDATSNRYPRRTPGRDVGAEEPLPDGPRR